MKEFLESVQKILEDRGKEYGNVDESFERIAKAWSLTLNRKITPIEACLMMIDFKVARLRNNPANVDSLRDIIGYVCCLFELGESSRITSSIKQEMENKIRSA